MEHCYGATLVVEAIATPLHGDDAAIVQHAVEGGRLALGDRA